MGFEAKRSNSIFTSSNRGLASKFGKVYIIFPFNSAKFTFSERHRDLVLGSDSMVEWIAYKPIDSKYKEDINDMWMEFKKVYAKVPSRKIPTVQNFIKLLGNVIKSKSSIDFFAMNNIYNYVLSMTSHKNVYPKFNTHYFNSIDAWNDDCTKLCAKFLPILRKMKKNIVFDTEIFQKKFVLNNKNFKGALRSENEVYIFGEYFALDREIYENRLEELLFNIKIKPKLGPTND